MRASRLRPAHPPAQASAPVTRPPEPPPDSPRPPVAKTSQQLVRGSVWMIASRWAMRFVGLISTMILARLLLPEDFGLVAMALLAYGLLETISYAGVDLALMRGGHDTRDFYDTAWTVQILQGLFIAVSLAVAAPLVANYFNEPRALAVILWACPRAVIESLQNIGVVAFRKELDFAKEFRYQLYNKAINFFVVIGAALWFGNYWALVFGSLVAAVIGVALSYRMHPYRPRLSLAKLREIWSFSQWLMISRIGSYLNRRCDEFVVGGVAGSSAMGSYHVAAELATLPSNELVMPIRRAMYPTLTKIAERKDDFVESVLSSFSTVSAMCLFVAFTLLSLAPEVVAIVLGAKWSEAVPLVRWLAVFGGFSALVLVLEVPLWVAGKTNVTALQSWLELAVIVPVTLYAVHAWGAEGAAAGRAGVAVLMVPLMMVFTARSGGVGFMRLLGALWRPLAAALLMAAAAHLLPLPPQAGTLISLLAKGGVCVLGFPALLWLLWRLAGRPRGFEPAAVEFLRAAWRRRRSAS